LSGWWRAELGEDPAYEADITPLMMSLLDPAAGERVLDVGCGEGRHMAELTAVHVHPFGVDLSQDLLETARLFGPVVRVMLPSLAALRDEVYDAALISLVLEHLEDEGALFAELGRVVRSGGRLALIVNHPIFTAPDSAPIQEDDEVLWRTGRYFDRGHTDEPAGDGTIRFYHRSLSALLTAASAGGWDLRRVTESGATETQVERHPPLAAQRNIPRLLGVLWSRRSR
jgi:SAM-dependent methyltransferase